MWKIDTNGNATNGVDKAITIQVEKSVRFDVFLHEKTDAGNCTTMLRVYLLKPTAKEFVRRLVDLFNAYGEEGIIQFAKLHEACTAREF